MDTLFGAPWGPVARTGAVLRAAAGRMGVSLHPVSEVELAAAVLGAQALAAITGVAPSSIGARYGQSVSVAAAAVLARAAGGAAAPGEWNGPSTTHPPAAVHAVIAAMAPAAAWVHEQLGSGSAEAWRLCAADLTSGASTEAGAVLEWVGAWCADQADKYQT